MKKKYLIVIADYYKEISKGLLNSALKLIPKSSVIKGQTPHFDFISQATTNAIMELSIKNNKPVGNGIITCLNIVQAKHRKKKGAEAAAAVNSILSQK